MQLATITLIVQILFYFVLCAGVVVQLAANRGKPHLYKWHDRLQAPVVVLNILFIAFVMIPTFRTVVFGQFPSGLREVPVLVAAIHGTLGIIAQGLAIYSLLAGFKIIPRKIGVLRYFMWAAFVAWTITILFGVGVFILVQTNVVASDEVTVAEHDADLGTEEVPAEAPIEAVEPVTEHAEEPVEVVVEPTEGPVEVVEEHAEEPVEVVEPIEEHAEEPVEIEPTEEPPEPPKQVGILRISDGPIHSDKVTVQMEGVAPPADGFVFEAWLQGDGQPPLSIGILNVADGNIAHEFIDPEGRRLLNLYNALFVTVEPADDSDPNPSDMKIYAGEVSPAAMEHVRHVVTAFPGSPDGDGLALNALADALRVLELVAVQQRYVDENNLVDLLVHAENTINYLEGTAGPNHGDIDGDGTVWAGDGFGLLRFGDSDGYIQSAAEHAILASESEGASAEVMLHAEHVNIAAANAIDRAGRIRELQLQIVQVGNAADTADLVTESIDLANALVDGIDANGDGLVAPVPGEGGVRTMYEHGQLMGSIEIFPVVGPEGVPAATPTPELISEHDADVAEVIEPEFTGEATQAEWLQLQPTNAGPGARYSHAMQYNAATNQLFLFGGHDGSQVYNDVWVLNMADLTWRQLAANAPVAPPGRHSAVMIVDAAAENLYVSVGQNPSGVLNDIWRLDISTQTWEDLTATAGEAPAPRYGSPGGNLGNNLLLTHGFGNTRYDDTWLFNTGNQEWENITPAGEVPLRRCLFAATTLATNNLVIHGGCASGFGDCYLDDTWVLDTTAGAWRQVSSEVKPVGRQHQTLTNVANQNQVVLMGGQDIDQMARDDAWLLDLATGEWRPISTSSSPGTRFNHQAAWVPASGDRPAGVLIFGGRRSGAILDDLWLLAFQGAESETTVPAEPTPTPTPELISEHDGG